MHYAALCWSDRVLVYPIQITDAFIRNAGSLHRCHVMLCRVPKDLRKACDKIVPGIGGMIEDDFPVWLRVVKFLKRHLSIFEVLNID